MTEMNNIKWFLRQLLPRTYWTKYKLDGQMYFEIWNMWFGVTYNELRFEVNNER